MKFVANMLTILDARGKTKKMAEDGGEGNGGEREDLEQHQSDGEGLGVVEGPRFCPVKGTSG